MCSKECDNRLYELRRAVKTYTMLINDMKGAFYRDELLKTLIKKTCYEIERLEELIFNNELELLEAGV